VRARISGRVFRPVQPETPPHYAWNAVAFGIDSSLFTVGMSLLGTTTILPALILGLTGSPVAVGLASAAVSGGWLLPQIFVASAVTRLKRKKPVVVWAAWLSRPIFFLLGLMVSLYGLRAPVLTTVILLGGLALFYVMDAVVSVPWFDLLAKGIPPWRRGRVLGTAQIVGGLGGMAAGAWVRYVLSDASPWSFPQNHAVLLASTSAVLMLSAVGISMIRESQGKAPSGPVPSPREVLRGLPLMLRSDRTFLRLVGTRILAGWVTIASPFYVLHATSVGGLAVEDTGLLVSAQVFGSLAAGLLMSVLQDRKGPLVHIRYTVVACGLPALIVLLLTPVLGMIGNVALYVYLIIFFVLGISASSMGWPFLNYVLEHASEERRPLYIGTINTLTALVMLAPPVGGWILRAFSYTPVLAIALGFAGAAFVAAARLPSTRAKPSPVPAEEPRQHEPTPRS